MVSEIIRWQTPLAHMRRTATRDTELAGKRIARGDKIAMWYVSANRDEDVFAQPNAFRIERENARDHLAFGRGVHFCLGAALARLEAQIAIPALLRRFPKLDGDTSRLHWHRSIILRGVEALPVSLR